MKKILLFTSLIILASCTHKHTQAVEQKDLTSGTNHTGQAYENFHSLTSGYDSDTTLQLDSVHYNHFFYSRELFHYRAELKTAVIDGDTLLYNIASNIREPKTGWQDTVYLGYGYWIMESK